MRIFLVKMTHCGIRGFLTLGCFTKHSLAYSLYIMLLWIGNITAAPYQPASASIVLEKVAPLDDSESKALLQLRQQLLRSPSDEKLAVTYAKQAIKQGRRLGDPRYFGYAEAALQKWLLLSLPSTEVLLLRASLKESKHDFSGALSDLQSALRQSPTNNQAWLNQANIFTVQGEYDQAVASCKQLRNVAPLIAATCLASAASLNGKAERSYRYLQHILQSNDNNESTIKLWSLTVLADIATRLGDYKNAENFYRSALSLDKKDTYLLGAYADLLIDSTRYREAIMLLQEHRSVDGLLLRLAIAKLKIQEPNVVQDIAEIEARFAANKLRGDDGIHLREEARFVLHILNQPKQALALAESNWLVQKEPWDHRILLESSIQSQNNTGIATIKQWMAKTGLEDKTLQMLLANNINNNQGR